MGIGSSYGVRGPSQNKVVQKDWGGGGRKLDTRDSPYLEKVYRIPRGRLGQRANGKVLVNGALQSAKAEQKNPISSSKENSRHNLQFKFSTTHTFSTILSVMYIWENSHCILSSMLTFYREICVPLRSHETLHYCRI